MLRFMGRTRGGCVPLATWLMGVPYSAGVPYVDRLTDKEDPRRISQSHKGHGHESKLHFGLNPAGNHVLAFSMATMDECGPHQPSGIATRNQIVIAVRYEPHKRGLTLHAISRVHAALPLKRRAGETGERAIVI